LLRPLVCNDFSAAGLLLGADRSRILPELRPHGHRFLDGRPLADFSIRRFTFGNSSMSILRVAQLDAQG
jgi:hypothetical protein